jgi:hypothetical protein
MQQSDFEKRVREKMDELNFTPSPPVWPHIEKQIRQKKERRRLLAWFFLLALVLGGGAWWMLGGMTGERMTDKGQPITDNRLPEKVEGGEVEGGEAGGDKVEGSKVEGGENTVTTDIEERNTVVRVKEKEIEGRTNVEKERVTGGSDVDSRETTAKLPAEKKQKVVIGKVKPEGEAALNTGRKNTRLTRPPIEKAKQDKPAADTQAVVMTPPAELPAKPLGQENKKEEATKEAGTETANTETGKDPQKEAAAQEPSADTAVAVQSNSSQQQETSKWTRGISVTVGVSGVGEGLRLFPTGLRMDNLYSSPSGGGPNTSPLPPSRVGDDFSFAVGYVMKRNTGKSLSYSTGLRYNYYSTSIAVGSRRSGGTITVSNGMGFINSDVIYSNARLSGSMDSANIYRNQYHFVSIPFDLEVKLGKIPLYASAGLSLQYMVATNALVYSYDTYVYYRQKKALNHLQVFGNIGLHYTFFQNKKHPVQLGPQLSYGLGRLEKISRSSLFAAGLTARMALGKKRI